jgi:hypothetical protein
MSEYEALRSDMADLGGAMSSYAGSVNRHADAVAAEFARLWADNAELRDELHAVSNRVEALTRAVMADPAEVADRVYDSPVSDLRGRTRPEAL